MDNCMKGGCPERDADTCPSCVHWEPSRGSKYARCGQYLTRKLLCSLPEGSCGTCSYYLPPGVLPPGRPSDTGIDWTDPKQVAEYRKLKKLQMAPAVATCGFPGCVKCPVHFHVSIYNGKARAHLCRAHFAAMGDK